MGMCHWNRPYNQLYDSMVSYKKSGTKIHKKRAGKIWLSVSRPRQDEKHPGLSGYRGRPDLELGHFLQD